MIEFGNLFYYFLFIFFIINLTIFSILLLKNKSNKFIHVFLFCLLLSGFIIHFLKLQIEPYISRWPQSLRYISFENICAVNTLLFPWFYLSKSKLLKDYMVIIGIVTGLATILFPYQSVGFNTITFDILRFYYAHFVLFLVPFLMVYTKQYQFNLKRLFKVPFVFYGVLILILANEITLISLGVVDGDINSLLNPNNRNNAIIFGPSHQTSKYEFIYSPFVPEVFKTVPFGPNAGSTMYWPIIWLIIPTYIYICIVGLMMDILFNILMKKKVSTAYSSSNNLPYLDDESLIEIN